MPCLDCGVPTNSSRCPKCFQIYSGNNPRPYKGSAASRGYDYAWTQVRLSILYRDKFICHYCSKFLVGKDATVDHIVPLAHGGERLDPSNLVASCRTCNSSKGDR